MIPTDPYQAPHAPFPSDIDDESGFIEDDESDENSEVKLRRKNIANEMWKSYLNYMADKETSNSDDMIDDDDFSDIGEY